MNDEHVLKVVCEGITFRPDKYGEFSAAPTVHPTVARMHLSTSHVHDLAPVSRENKRGTSQQARITNIEIAHWRSLADLF